MPRTAGVPTTTMNVDLYNTDFSKKMAISAADAGSVARSDDTHSTTRNSSFLENDTATGNSSQFSGDFTTTATTTLRSSSRIDEEDKAAQVLSRTSWAQESKRNSDFLESQLTANKLQFSNLHLVGRDKEMKALQECFDRCCGSGSKELVFIQGVSGIGKSALVDAFIGQQKKGKLPKLITGHGKYDHFLRDEPYSAFLDVFQSICADLELSDSDKIQEFRTELLEHLDEEERLLLVTMIPKLREITDCDVSDIASDDSPSEFPPAVIAVVDDAVESKSQRTKNIYRKFCRILTAHFAPVVISLDDMQWADGPSLELLEVLMKDQETSKIMFLGCFRSDEVLAVDSESKQHPLLQLRDRLGSLHGRSHISEVDVKNVSFDEVNQVIMTLLSIDDTEKTLDLARLCHERTMGNPFFLVQFLVMLKAEGLLEFNLGLFKWTWNVTSIETKTVVTPNVIALVTQRISKLPPDLLSFLQLASLLGSSFSTETLWVVWKHTKTRNDTPESCEYQKDDEVFHGLLQHAVDTKFIEVNHSSGSCRWMHDNIQEATMSCIRDRDLKGRVGMILLRRLSSEGLDGEIYTVANMLSNYSPTEDEVIDVISLFARASEKAVSFAAFQSAYNNATKGVSMLPPNCWETHFDLSLQLYSVATEASSYLGMTDEMSVFSSTVLDRPECTTFHKLRVYYVVLDYLGNNGRPYEAIDLALNILDDLGCSFPRNAFSQTARMLCAIRKWRRNAPTAEDMRELPVMTDENMKESIKVIYRLVTFLYYTKQIALHFLTCSRVVDMVLGHGIADFAGQAFGIIGMVLSVVSGEVKYMKQWSELSRLVSQLSPSGRDESRIIYTTSVFLSWTTPIPKLAKDTMVGYKAGMRVGDTESACYCMWIDLVLQFMAGRRLPLLVEDGRLYILQMKEFNKNEAALLTSTHWQLIQNLTLTSTSCSQLAGEAFDGLDTEQAVEEMVNTTSDFAAFFFTAYKLILRGYSRQYVAGAELALAIGPSFLGKVPWQTIAMYATFHTGLCFFSAARITNTNQRKFIRGGRSSKAALKNWLQQGNPNIRHQFSLLEAEDLVSKKKYKEAQRHFENAIRDAIRSGFIHDAAIARERYGIFLNDIVGDLEGSALQFDEALCLYSEWGADALLDGLHTIKRERASC